MSDTYSPTVAVAGASGFIGRYLPDVFEELNRSIELVGLTRDVELADVEQGAGYRWRLCDLFSRLDTRRAVKGADYGIYMVHSARPSARLSQAEPADLDVLCADNFARAANAHDLEHIVHVTGILNEDEDADNSRPEPGELHRTLASSGVPVTTLRADMIIGAGGMTTQTLIKLVRHLPLMGCPSWTNIPVRPVYVQDFARVIATSLAQDGLYETTHDIGGPESLSYLDMMRQTAEVMDLDRRFYDIPVNSPRLSSLWVSTFGLVKYSVVRQLIEGLREAPASEVSPLAEKMSVSLRPFRDTIRRTLEDREDFKEGRSRLRALPEPEGDDTPDRDHEVTPDDEPDSDEESRAIVERRETLPSKRGTSHVRSVQRLPLPPETTARWVALEYARWLPDSMGPFLRATVDEQRTCRFYLRFFWKPLLILEFDAEVSTPDRQLFWITGGLLATGSERGRLEFREVLDRSSVLAAIHEFEPALPWWIYRFTQAIVHLWVMIRFSRHLSDVEPESHTPLPEPAEVGD